MARKPGKGSKASASGYRVRDTELARCCSHGSTVGEHNGRTRILLTIALLESSYLREIARVTGAPPMSVQRIVNDYERQGVLASRRVGVL
ncbi:MAG: hypothetical protein ACYDA5_09615 [Vulcanimicrobiaceae bacterium]